MQPQTGDHSLAGRVAIVTGAGRGIGLTISMTLADAGAGVAAVARTKDQVEDICASIRARGGTAIPLVADVRDWAQVQAMANAAAAELGPVDILVSNAGTHSAIGLPWEVEVDDFVADMETSILGPFLCQKAVVPGMVARGQGRVINITSGAATEPRPWSAAYCAAKTGLQRFTEAMAIAAGAYGVHVFSLNPGPVKTPMNVTNMNSAAGRRFYPDMAGMSFLPPEKVASYALTMASGRADRLAGRFVAAFDDLEALIAEADTIVETNSRRLEIGRRA
ncbi:MAG: SDR family NAD(P)-dependent oxidoreductase [Dehalococcoidia bacterium]